MNNQRYRELELGNKKLTKEELADGWHFCPDWDYMLIHKSWPEYKACLCNRETENV